MPEGFDKLLLAGVLDARSSLPEEPRELAAFVAEARERGWSGSRSSRTATCSTSPSRYAREKLARLGKARTATTEAAA